jgi:hypothetical protein
LIFNSVTFVTFVTLFYSVKIKKGYNPLFLSSEKNETVSNWEHVTVDAWIGEQKREITIERPMDRGGEHYSVKEGLKPLAEFWVMQHRQVTDFELEFLWKDGKVLHFDVSRFGWLTADEIIEIVDIIRYRFTPYK